MTNPPPEPSNRPNFSARISQLMQNPAFWTGGVIALGLGMGGFVGLRYWVDHQLPSYLEAQLEQFLQRPVQIGKVESFSLGGIRIGSSSIPATAKDRDRLSIQGIALGVNPFPLLLGQPLALNIELDRPQLYLDQNQAGQWINLELPKGKAQELPVGIDAQLRIKNADLALKPNISPQAIALTADGRGEYRYRGSKRQWVSYDLDARVFKSAIAIQGNTTLETGASQVALQVKQLSLQDLAGVLANSAFKPKQGLINANLAADFPGFSQLEQTQGQGQLSLKGIETQIAPLKFPFKLNLDLKLQGQTLLVQQLQASMGKISAQAQGRVHWQKGYDLQVTLNPVALSELPKTFRFDYPFPITGEAGARMQILGKITDPTVTGVIQNSQPLQIDRTAIKRFKTTFQADLNQISLYQVQIQPTAGGEIRGQGRLQTNLQAANKAHQPIDWLKMPVSFDFKANLPAQPLLNPYYRSTNRVNLGAIATLGKITGTFAQPQAEVRWTSAALATLDQETVKGAGTFRYGGQQFVLQDTVLTTNGGQVNLAARGDFKTQRGQAQLGAQAFALSPLIPVFCSLTACPTALTRSAILLNQADVRLQSPLNNFRLDRITGVANLNLRVDGGSAAIQSVLNQGQIQGQVVASSFPLNPYLPNVTMPVSLRRSQISFAGSIATVLAGQAFDARGLKADLAADLSVNHRPLSATGALRQGQLQAIAQLKAFPLQTLVSALPVAADLQNARVQIAGDVNSLLASLGKQQPDLSLLQAQAQGDIAIPGGRIQARASLAQNRWQGEVWTRDLKANALLRSLSSTRPAIAIAPITAQVKLSGGVADWFNPGAEISLAVDRVAIASGRQDLQAQGTLILAAPSSKWDIKQVNLQVQAQGYLDDLPLTQLLAQVPVRPDFLPEQITLTGNGRFQGQLLAQNLISAPTAPGSLQLKGNVDLHRLVFNQRAFEPRLTGTLKATLGQTIALNLRGSQDVLAAAFIPCTRAQCLAPYIPAALELRQTYNNPQPLIAQAQLQGDRLVGRLEQFPLALLQLSPGKSYGIPGYLEGEVNSEFALNPYSLQGEGTVTVQNPRLGAIEVQGFSAKLAFRDAVARLSDATLRLGDSLYNVDGALNLRNGALQATLAVNRGQVQDLLAALKLSDLDSLITLLKFRPQSYPSGFAVIPDPVGSPEATLGELVNLLGQIDEKIKARAQELRKGSVPTTLDIRGIFDAKISLGGTLRQPTAQFQVSGHHWEWYPQRSFPNIIPPLGLVMTNSQAIPLNQLEIQGSFGQGRLKINPARLQIREAELAIAGQLSLLTQKIEGTFRLDRLNFDTIGSLVKVPLDISGDINLLGQVTGSLKAPQVVGTFGFVEGALNARSLNLDILGKFNYRDQQLTLATTQPSSIAAYVSVPLPPTTQRNEANLQLRLNTASIQLINILTQDQLTWLGGEGSLAFDARVRIDPDEVLSLNAIANGKLFLKDAVIKSAALPHPLTVNGEATLTQDGLNVDQLLGQFDQSQLLISGFLPLFAPPSPVNNPLTLQINKGRVNLENLFAGEIDGQIIVRGNAFNPILGGGVQLANGQVFLPQSRVAENKIVSAISRWSKPLQKKAGGHLELDHLQVTLRNLAIEQLPLYRFEFGGDLLLNGNLANLQTLEPKGEIAIALGRVSFFDTRFLIDRRQRNRITFRPERGLLNPDVDIAMRTIVSDLPNSQRLRSDNSNEVPIDSITKIQRVDIGLNIKGALSQLLPNLNPDTNQICLRNSSSALIQPNASFSSSELARLTRCLEILAAKDNADEQIFNNPAIRLTSNPSRSQGEIIRLLGEQLLVLADALQGKNTDQLIQVGIVQLALPMVFQGVVYDVETAISNTVGSTDFRIVPFLEAVYRVDQDGFVRMGYDYSSNEIRVQYEKRF